MKFFLLSTLILSLDFCQYQERNNDDKFRALGQINSIFGFLPNLEVGNAVCYGDSTYINSVWYQRNESNWNRYIICHFSDKDKSVFQIKIRRGIDQEWKNDKEIIRMIDEGPIYFYKVANCAIWFNRFYTESRDRDSYKWTPSRVESFNKFYHHIANTLEKSGFCND